MSNPLNHEKSPEQHGSTDTSHQQPKGGDSQNEQNQSEITTAKLKASETELVRIQNMITETHGRELWVAVKTGIAVVAATSLTQRSNPLVVIFEGGSRRDGTRPRAALLPRHGANLPPASISSACRYAQGVSRFSEQIIWLVVPAGESNDILHLHPGSRITLSRLTGIRA